MCPPGPRPRSLFFPAVRSVVRVFLRIAFASHLNRDRDKQSDTHSHTGTRHSHTHTGTHNICISVTCTFDCCSCCCSAAAAAARAARRCCRSCVCLCPQARRWSFYSPLSLDSFFTWHFSTFPFAIVISAFVGCVWVCVSLCVGGGGERVDGWLRAWSILLSCFLFKTICLA